MVGHRKSPPMGMRIGFGYPNIRRLMIVHNLYGFNSISKRSLTTLCFASLQSSL